jgi:hypothetical protein
LELSDHIGTHESNIGHVRRHVAHSQRSALQEDTWIADHCGRGSIRLTSCWRVHHLGEGALTPKSVDIMVAAGGIYLHV